MANLSCLPTNTLNRMYRRCYNKAVRAGGAAFGADLPTLFAKDEALATLSCNLLTELNKREFPARKPTWRRG